jgi:hypothetical protein
VGVFFNISRARGLLPAVDRPMLCEPRVRARCVRVGHRLGRACVVAGRTKEVGFLFFF